jgi:hypothetical protein
MLLSTLDAMVSEGWVTASQDPSRPMYQRLQGENPHLRSNTSGNEALERRKAVSRAHEDGGSNGAL